MTLALAGDMALEADALDEASGMETRGRGGFWILEDSGNRSELFAVGPRGEDLGRAAIVGTDNEDWEDLASYNDPSGRRMLLIADTGDNDAERLSVVLSTVAEDRVEQALRRGAAPVEHIWDVRIPTGAADIEAVAVEPGTQMVYLLTKREVPTILWAFSLSEGRELTRVGELLLPQPTDEQLDADPRFGHTASYPTAMDFTPDGSALVVQTYTDAFIVRRAADGTLDLEHPTRLPLTKLTQTEAACVGADGYWWYTSEQRPAAMMRQALPAVP